MTTKDDYAQAADSLERIMGNTATSSSYLAVWTALHITAIRAALRAMAGGHEAWLVRRYGETYATTEKPLANDGRPVLIVEKPE